LTILTTVFMYCYVINSHLSPISHILFSILRLETRKLKLYQQNITCEIHLATHMRVLT